jgi:hypothetical protein
LVEINMSICRHKNPTKIRITAQGPTVRWQFLPRQMKVQNCELIPVQWWMWWIQEQVSRLTSPSQVKLIISLPLRYWMSSHWGLYY